MNTFTGRLNLIFTELDRRIALLAKERAEIGGPKIARAEVRVLGQMSLLSNEQVSSKIALADTADLDAHLRTESVVENELRRILKEHGLVYDETSGEIWIPPGATFETLFDFERVKVTRIDPESALVSKAVKAQQKNRVLIQDALGSGVFPDLAERIEKYGGKLGYFLESQGTKP